MRGQLCAALSALLALALPGLLAADHAQKPLAIQVYIDHSEPLRPHPAQDTAFLLETTARVSAEIRQRAAASSHGIRVRTYLFAATLDGTPYVDGDAGRNAANVAAGWAALQRMLAGPRGAAVEGPGLNRHRTDLAAVLHHVGSMDRTHYEIPSAALIISNGVHDPHGTRNGCSPVISASARETDELRRMAAKLPIRTALLMTPCAREMTAAMYPMEVLWRNVADSARFRPFLSHGPGGLDENAIREAFDFLQPRLVVGAPTGVETTYGRRPLRFDLHTDGTDPVRLNLCLVGLAPVNERAHDVLPGRDIYLGREAASPPGGMKCIHPQAFSGPQRVGVEVNFSPETVTRLLGQTAEWIMQIVWTSHHDLTPHTLGVRIAYGPPWIAKVLLGDLYGLLSNRSIARVVLLLTTLLLVAAAFQQRRGWFSYGWKVRWSLHTAATGGAAVIARVDDLLPEFSWREAFIVRPFKVASEFGFSQDEMHPAVTADALRLWPLANGRLCIVTTSDSRIETLSSSEPAHPTGKAAAQPSPRRLTKRTAETFDRSELASCHWIGLEKGAKTLLAVSASWEKHGRFGVLLRAIACRGWWGQRGMAIVWVLSFAFLVAPVYVAVRYDLWGEMIGILAWESPVLIGTASCLLLFYWPRLRRLRRLLQDFVDELPDVIDHFARTAK